MNFKKNDYKKPTWHSKEDDSLEEDIEDEELEEELSGLKNLLKELLEECKKLNLLLQNKI